MTLSGLRLQLCDLLGTEVDLSSASAMKEPVRANADREAVHVF
jgi:predicted nucleotidyltransferase